MDNELFRDLRAYLGLTQREFANKLKVHRSTIGNIECGLLPLSDGIRMRAFRAFDIDAEMLEKLKQYRQLSM
ncbi:MULTISPECIES: helix-turn-helix domain-containing protein [Bacillus cereus group]|uniref:helix-turn-helix domain-containing protein n=1 Tax=Bacillus cereus group TaxID=86661 RepID=UPI001C01A3CD|nr:helix-turn-helix transcriptional regulator [Bacillus mycoides]QWG63407.1 XRE family transcriptional regulator [Bacillus mycoides]QWG89583.1 XRE family transcriptional regulator [Bacillus mycoides]QWJ08333.1 helix-turn-helix transcriptional regulator [Bacillus mycoides]